MQGISVARDKLTMTGSSNPYSHQRPVDVDCDKTRPVQSRGWPTEGFSRLKLIVCAHVAKTGVGSGRSFANFLRSWAVAANGWEYPRTTLSPSSGYAFYWCSTRKLAQLAQHNVLYVTLTFLDLEPTLP